MRQALAGSGPIDILIHNVGERDRRPFAEIEPEDFARLIDVDLSAAHALIRLVVPDMLKQGWGRLILVSSIAGQLAVPAASSYIAAKGGLTALARALAAELGATGITANALSPGFFGTETNAKLMASPMGERQRERCPAKRWADPSEIAGAALFLASPAASYVNGHTLIVDGGVSATYLALKDGGSVIAEHFVQRWQKAGLIDDDLARRIVDWEVANRRRPVVLWAIAGMGALAMALGVMAIVGANWESIPAWLKLALDLGLNGACAVAVPCLCWRQQRFWLREIGKWRCCCSAWC